MSVQYTEKNGDARKALTERMLQGDMTVSNKEVTAAYEIDPYFDVNDIPLDSIDPSHPALFQHDTLWDHFARLRREDPVHYHEESNFPFTCHLLRFWFLE